MERSTRVAVSSLNELKVRYFNLQKDISEYDSIRGNKANEELQEKIERYETEIEEYQVKSLKITTVQTLKEMSPIINFMRDTLANLKKHLWQISFKLTPAAKNRRLFSKSAFPSFTAFAFIETWAHTPIHASVQWCSNSGTITRDRLYMCTQAKWRYWNYFKTGNCAIDNSKISCSVGMLTSNTNGQANIYSRMFFQKQNTWLPV